MNTDITSLSFWAGPILGAIIGLITNGIAIRMLFRPLHPVYIGKYQLPFTPGLIPKEQARIASSVGKVVSEELFNAEILEKGLINENIDGKISSSIEVMFMHARESDETVKDVLLRYFNEKDLEENLDYVLKSSSAYIYKKAVTMNLGEQSVNFILENLDERLNESSGMLKYLSGSLGGMLKEPLVNIIDSVVEKQAFQLVYSALKSEGDQLLDMKISDLAARYEASIPKIESFILKAYHSAVREYLPGALKAIHMDRLVEEQINSYSPAEMERLLLELMKKELGAIIYLGGFLGFFMGMIMNFV